MAQYRFKGKAPELIKIAIAAGTTNTFFDTTNDYEPVIFESSDLEYTYSNQIFFNVASNKNMIWLSAAVTGDCLEDMLSFVNYTFWILEGGDWHDDGDWDDTGVWID